MPRDEWKFWKTVKIGTGLRTAEDFRAAFTEAGCRLGNWANDILGRPAFTAGVVEEEVGLVVATVAELGFKEAAKLKDIYERAASLGLALCPAEVGPQLRLQYKDQPEGEWLRVSMEPIMVSDGHLFVFDVDSDGGGLWLYGVDGGLGRFWCHDVRCVFVRRK